MIVQLSMNSGDIHDEKITEQSIYNGQPSA